jgi:hypothetical protein
MTSSLVLRKIAGIVFLSSSLFLILGLVTSFDELTEYNAELIIFNFTLLILLLSAGVISLISRVKAPLFTVLSIYLIISLLYTTYSVIKFGYLKDGLTFTLGWVSQFYLPTGYLITRIPSAIFYDLCNLSVLAGAVLVIVSSTLSTNDTKIES